MSYLAGFFLVFSGMLFGYLFRYRSQQDELATNKSLATENQDLRTSMRLAHDSNRSLDEKQGRQSSRLKIVSGLCDEWSNDRQQLERDRTQLEQAVEAGNTRVEELTAALDSKERAVEAVREEDEKSATELIGLQKRVENQESTLAQQREQLTEIREREKTLKERDDVLTAKVQELTTTCQRISELEKLVRHRDQEDQQIIAELRSVREQYAASYQREQELTVRLESINADHDSESVVPDQGALIQSLKRKIDDADETNQSLRRELADALARMSNLRSVVDSNATVLSFTDAMARRREDAAGFDQEYGGPTLLHELRGVIFTDVPQCVDDLKQIKGIADVLEARLNDCGVFTFRQIMEWQPESIEEFSRLFACRDRIESESWVDQARKLYHAKEDGQRKSAA